MDSLEILKEAIRLRKPVLYQYNLEGKAIGVRRGHPHAIFISNKGNVNIDIYKTAGVTSNPNKILPGWQQYIVIHIENVEILHDETEFEIADDYNPYSKQYQRVIVKI